MNRKSSYYATSPATKASDRSYCSSRVAYTPCSARRVAFFLPEMRLDRRSVTDEIPVTDFLHLYAIEYINLDGSR